MKLSFVENRGMLILSIGYFGAQSLTENMFIYKE